MEGRPPFLLKVYSVLFFGIEQTQMSTEIDSMLLYNVFLKITGVHIKIRSRVFPKHT